MYKIKVKNVIIAILILVTLLSGAMLTVILINKHQSEKQAENLGRDYLKKLYTVKDYKQYDNVVSDYPESFSDLKKYFDKEGYEGFIINRIPLYYYEAAFKGKHDIALEKCSLNKKNKSKNQIDFNYSAKLKLNYAELGKKEYTDESGKIYLKKLKGNWKIYSEDISYSSKIFSEEITNYNKEQEDKEAQIDIISVDDLEVPSDWSKAELDLYSLYTPKTWSLIKNSGTSVTFYNNDRAMGHLIYHKNDNSIRLESFLGSGISNVKAYKLNGYNYSKAYLYKLDKIEPKESFESDVAKETWYLFIDNTKNLIVELFLFDKYVDEKTMRILSKSISSK